MPLRNGSVLLGFGTGRPENNFGAPFGVLAFLLGDLIAGFDNIFSSHFILLLYLMH